jgi:hypothetical protein
MNTRNFTRVNYTAGAAIKFGSEVVLCKTGNLSIQGMYLKTENDLPLNEPVHVTVYKSNESSFKVDAKIIRKEEGGVGLQINGVSARSFAQLRDIITDHCTDHGKVISETLLMLKCIQ